MAFWAVGKTSSIEVMNCLLYHLWEAAWEGSLLALWKTISLLQVRDELRGLKIYVGQEKFDEMYRLALSP